MCSIQTSVCACVRACVRVCVRAGVRVCVTLTARKKRSVTTKDDGVTLQRAISKAMRKKGSSFERDNAPAAH